MPAPSAADSLRSENIFNDVGDKIKSVYAKMTSTIEDDESLDQL